MSEEKKQYEISYLVRTEADKNAVLKVLRETAAVNFQEGKITEIKLSYPVKKQTSAFFGSIIFEVFPEAIAKINNSLKFSGEVLRFIIITPLAKKLHPYFDGKDKTITDLSSIKGSQAERMRSSAEEIEKLEEREKVDDIAFDERLEEILTNTQTK